MNLAALWPAITRWYGTHSVRDQRIIMGVVVAVGLSIAWIAIVDPLRAYRRGVAQEISDGQEELERSARFVGALESLEAEREDLKKKLAQAKTRLLPGDSGTLGAAALQERANAIATEKGVTVQSTQVMKEEVQEPFRRVAVRLTLQGELKPFADLISGLEYGQQLSIPFLEVSRRGAVPGAKGPRTLTATLEVNGYVLAGGGATPKDAEAPEGEPAADAQPGEGAPAEAAAGAPEGQPAAPAEGQAAPATGEGAGAAAPAGGAPTTGAAATGAEPAPTPKPSDKPAAPDGKPTGEAPSDTGTPAPGVKAPPEHGAPATPVPAPTPEHAPPPAPGAPAAGPTKAHPDDKLIPDAPPSAHSEGKQP